VVQYQEVPNPENTPESVWDAGWRWWIACGAAVLVILSGLAVLAVPFAMWEGR
jgi:anti-sigma-K factor RskA